MACVGALRTCGAPAPLTLGVSLQVMPRYFETDMTEDALSSLELASHFYRAAQNDDRFWKWFVLALHSSMQGVFAMALDDGSSTLVQKPKNAEAMLSAFASGTSPPEPHMDNFQRLYRKLQSQTSLLVGRLSLPASKRHEAAIHGLDEIRDDFVHFNTKGWLVDLDLIESVARGSAEVLSFLLFKSNRVTWYEVNQSARASKAMSSLREALQIEG
jgi:hypothetical protein